MGGGRAALAPPGGDNQHRSHPACYHHGPEDEEHKPRPVGVSIPFQTILRLGGGSFFQAAGKGLLALGGIGVVGNLQGVQGFPGIANLQGVIGAGHGGIRTGDGVGVDAHYHPLVIYQGPAGVAGVDGGSGLDEVPGEQALLGGDRHAVKKPGHGPVGQGDVFHGGQKEALGRGVVGDGRIAQRVYIVPHLQRVLLLQKGQGKPALYGLRRLEDRHVGVILRAHVNHPEGHGTAGVQLEGLGVVGEIVQQDIVAGDGTFEVYGGPVHFRRAAFLAFFQGHHVAVGDENIRLLPRGAHAEGAAGTIALQCPHRFPGFQGIQVRLHLHNHPDHAAAGFRWGLQRQGSPGDENCAKNCH